MTAIGVSDNLRALRVLGDRAVAAGLWSIPDRRRRLYKLYGELRYQRHLGWSMDHCHEHFSSDRLPRRYGAGLTERAVEFGWALHNTPGGNALDAGSALNHTVTLDRFLPVVESLTIVTLAPEKRSWPERGVRYLYQDLRALELEDSLFDTVISISTLEHVGLDNARFDGAIGERGDPDAGARKAIQELARVAKPTGTILITVPFGASWRNDWVRVFDGGELDDLIAAAGPISREETIYRRADNGWHHVTRAQAADARYREWRAEAVACVRLNLGVGNSDAPAPG